MSKSKLYDEIGAFTTFPNWAVEMGTEIGTDGLILLLVLRYHSGEKGIVFPAYDTIQKESGLNRHQIARAIRRLEELKIIERQKRFGQSTIYRLKNRLPATSSAESALMEELPVVQNLHYSSAELTLSLVQNQHTNKTHLTRLNEQEEEKPSAPVFFDPAKEVAPMIARVSNMAYIPDTSKIEPLIRMIEAYGLEKTEDELKKQFAKWRNTKRKDNSGSYRPTNMGWVDWAQDELVGKPPEKKFEDCVTVDEMIEWHNTHQA